MTDLPEPPATRCPICDGERLAPPLATYSVGRAATHFCPMTRDPDRHARLAACLRRLWGGESCAVRACPACGFACGDPYVAGDGEFYGILHEQAGYPSWKWDFDVGLAAARQVGGARSALDIGAGAGAFLKALPPPWRLAATEGSETTRQALRAQGVRVFAGLDEAAAAGERFQLVTLFQVLEHLAPVGPTLARCRELIDDGGRLVVVVPDGVAMGRQEAVTGCADMPPNHVNRWTEASLNLALGRAGFEVTEVLRQPWRASKLANLAHLRVASDAGNPRSLAAQAYRIRRKSVRKVFLRALGVPALLRMLPKLRQWPMSGALAVVAVPKGPTP